MELRLDYEELRVLGALATDGQCTWYACSRVDDQTLALRLGLDLAAVSDRLAGRQAVATVHLQLSLLDAETMVLRLSAFHLDAAPVAFLLRPLLESTAIQRAIFARLKPRPGLAVAPETRTLQIRPNLLLEKPLRGSRLQLRRLCVTPAGLELSLTLHAAPSPPPAAGNPPQPAVSQAQDSEPGANAPAPR